MLGRLIWLLIILAVIGLGAFAVRFVVDRITGRETSERPVPWRDVKALSLATQVGAIGLIATIGIYLWSNFRNRTDAIGLELSFDFLDQPAGLTIADNPLSPADTVREALQAGFENTIRIIIVGVPLTFAIGTLIAIARLSSNWLLRKVATGYVEFFRNLPPLLVIIFVWRAVYLESFPAPRESWKPAGGWFIFNNSRFSLPSVTGLDNFETFRVVLLAGLIAAVVVWIWRSRTFDATGRPHHRVMWSTGTFVLIGVVAFVALGGPAEFSKPMIDADGRLYTNGFRMQMPYAAVGTGLVLYTASHIAEIVRGSILAVHKGQVEAGNALALSGFQRYRFIVLPQAMRIAFPPLISQFLNFSKNSSLAVAVGFAEATSMFNSLQGQSQPAPQLILLLMIGYLVISLTISLVGNGINRRLQLVGR